MTTKTKVVIAVGVLLGLLALYMLVQRSTTPASAAVTPTTLAKKMTRKQIQALIGASMQLAVGKEKKAKKTLRKAFGGRGWQMRIPMGGVRKKKRVRFMPGASRRAGCAYAYVEGKWETSIVGFDVLKSAMKQKWCWRSGKITFVGKRDTYQHVTEWGALMNWHEDGFRDGSNGWTNYGGRKHGGHYTNKTAKFKACAPVPTGCILPTERKIRMSLLEHGDGQFFTNLEY